MKILVLAIGKARGPELEWAEEYLKRFKNDVTVREMAASKSLPTLETQKAEAELLLKAIPPKSQVVLLDERGKNLTSRDLATKLKKLEEDGIANLCIIIGGADGVTEDVKQRADMTISFGQATWPHRLVRVMLLEQIYRAQQINAGHPYHRD